MGKDLLNKIVTWGYFFPLLYGNWYQRRKYLLPLYARLEPKDARIEPIDSGKTVIYMCLNETTFSGGLTDRLRGIVSIYKMCKEMDLPFRLYCQTPRLEDYLKPNVYDWRIAPEEICFDTDRCYPCSILTYHKNIKDRMQMFAQKTMLKHYIKKPFRQIHVYTNMVYGEDEFCTLYNELFKPSPDLLKQIDYHLEKIGGKETYISIVYRFRQLLGDFHEWGDVLPEDERMVYINKCIGLIERVHEDNPGKKILVTSDSVTFLKEVDKLPYTYIIPGEVVHMGFTYDASKVAYMKSFVDMYMLAYSSKIILARDEKMYHSGFAKRSAMLFEAKYEEIHI